MVPGIRAHATRAQTAKGEDILGNMQQDVINRLAAAAHLGFEAVFGYFIYLILIKYFIKN